MKIASALLYTMCLTSLDIFVFLSNTRDMKHLLELNLDEVKAQSKKGKLLNNQFFQVLEVSRISSLNFLQGFHLCNPYTWRMSFTSPRKSMAHHSSTLSSSKTLKRTGTWYPWITLISVLRSSVCWLGSTSAPFKIVLATVQYGNPNFYRPSMSVTSKVQSHVVRESVLFLNVGRDFGSNFGTLTLAYKVKDKFYSIVIHFDGSSVIVLNEYNGCCAVLAHLAKTHENCLLMAQVPGLLDASTDLFQAKLRLSSEYIPMSTK
jgi:hypothetical protein